MKQTLFARWLIYALMFIGLPLVSTAQIDLEPLPETSDKLHEEIGKILSYQNQQESLEILELYKKNIKEQRITDEHNTGLIRLGNEMIKRKMKRFNYFKYVIATINGFAADNNLSSKYFNQWVDISIAILNDQPEGKTAQFEDYLKFTTYFWANGNLYQASMNGGGHVWRAESKDFTMKYVKGELSIRYEMTNLYAFNRTDSLIINNARGTYYPLTESWKGERGRVEWNQDGARDAYCDIRDFDISARNVDLKCDKATLNYPSIFKKPIEGKLIDRITKRKATGMTHPVFESESRDIKIDDIGEGVSYEGGFIMRGSVVRGYGDAKGKSTVYIHDRANRQIVKAAAADFDIIKGERVISDDAEVSVYMQTEKGTDSIYHPNIRITYNIQTRELELIRGSSQASRVPFFNSFQQVEINTPVLRWKIDSTQVRLGDDSQDASFDSETYFDIGVYERYQPNTAYNYINIFASYSEKLQQYKKELEENKCKTEPAEQENIDNSICEFYPESCAIDPKTGKLVPKERLNSDAPPVETPTTPFAKIDPLEIHGNLLARLLDKRLEGRIFLTPCEIQKKEQEMQEKFGERYKKSQPYRQFMKSVIDITLVEAATNNPASDHDITNTRRLFLDMVADGLVVFNNEDTLVSLRPKLFHYHKSSNTKKTDHDFDNLRIKSIRGDKQKSDRNATLDLASGDINVGKVQQFVLSKTQQVFAQLDAGGNKVTLKQGRDMDFSGDLYAGFFQFSGRSFHFNYRDFNVYMDTIDAIFINIYKRFRHDEIMSEEELTLNPQYKNRFSNLRYYDLEEDGTKKLSTEKVLLRSHISNTRGLLQIDLSNNKSGRQKSDGKHPFFDTGENPGGFVYYDVPENIQGADAYPRDRFYYELAPFYRDTLDNFSPEKWSLKGKFYSADILPTVSEPIRIMFHDLSLGFEMETPTQSGFPIYLRDDPEKGKGLFKGVFGVSNEGLLGRGMINYLGARIESDYIVFLPERFTAENVDSFNLERSTQDGVEYPKVAGKDVVIDWAPYSDSMYIESNITDGIPFKLFDSGDFALNGSLILTPSGLLGRGEFDWKEGTLTSNPGGDFIFGSNKISSISTAAIIKSTGFQEFAFQNDNVEAVVDFDKRIGDFISNEKDLSTDLPYNNYKTSLDRFHWEMDKQKILIESTQGKAGFFLATEQSQDSLFFLGEKADYDLNTGLLQIDGVDYIRVADAFIYPKDRHVEIEERAHMRTLTDSKVVADTANQNHLIQRATINILSRREYNADGYLEFNVEGHKDQEIKFNNVRVEQAGPGSYVTKGSGTVEEQATFYLDKKTRFKGDVNLSADSKDLIFKGFAKLTSQVLPVQEWFSIDSRIDKKNVAITYNEPQSPDGSTLHVGIFISADSGLIYPAIMAPKYNIEDRSVFSTTGVLHYSPKDDMYMFGDSAKVLTDTMPGKKMTVSEKTGKVTAEGRFDFQNGFNRPGMPFVGVDAIGDFSFFLNKKSDYRFDMSLNIDMALPTKLIDFIANDLQSQPDVIEPILYTSVSNMRFKRFLFEFLNNQKTFEKTWKRVEEDNRLNLPSEFSHTFFFSKLTMAWSEKTQSFVSIGNLQLASLGGKHVGQVLQGGVEIIPDPLRGDVLNLYLISPSGEWYFFTYQGDVVSTASSKPEYQNELTALKSKDRKLKTANGESLKIELSNAGTYGPVKSRIQGAF